MYLDQMILLKKLRKLIYDSTRFTIKNKFETLKISPFKGGFKMAIYAEGFFSEVIFTEKMLDKFFKKYQKWKMFGEIEKTISRKLGGLEKQSKLKAGEIYAKNEGFDEPKDTIV